MNTTKVNATKEIPTKTDSTKMKAVISTGYGSPDVFQIREVPKPVPKDQEILIKIHASAVTRAGSMMRTGKPYIGRLFLGLRRPKHPIPGTGLAGEVEAVGKAVTLFKKGDQVFGESIFIFSANAEYICLPQDGVLAIKPANITYEEAAPVCDGPLTVMNFLKNLANIQPGQSILVNGASGSLGTAAVQLAKYYGAKVTGVCSGKNVDLVKSLGADKVIDYTTSDFTKNGETYDIIFDTVGKSSFSSCKNSLKPKGAYLSPVLSWPLLFQVLWTSLFSKKKAKFSATGTLAAAELKTFLQELVEVIKTGKLKSVMDRSYPMEQIAAAHNYIDKGHKKGNIVISLTPNI